ncbi:MAG: hypothetical protein CUN55_00780 [Phototrophicales bacterium]|nr:MAG: hypothetical protein CUN55_00780 [Phototrophicales bacterium]
MWTSIFRRGVIAGGGIIGYPLDRLHEEVAFIAMHLHWSRAEILSLGHRERVRWVHYINRANRQRFM